MRFGRPSGIVFLFTLAAVLVVSCSHGQPTPGVGHIHVTSTAFANNDAIPPQYTCSGANISPPLEWSNVPSGTRSVALICDDPDASAGDWVHWVLYNFPPDIHRLHEDVPASLTLTSGARQGINDFEHVGYGGPCPPNGAPHHYHFHVYAIDKRLDLPDNVSKTDLETAILGHVLAEGELVGTFGHDGSS